MTINEYKNKLDELSDEDFKSFCEDFGGGFKSRPEVVRGFVDNPKFERRICQLLSLKTEEEKMTAATVSSSKAANTSAKCAICAIIISLLAIFIGLYSILH